jgi:hypothetical protein
MEGRPFPVLEGRLSPWRTGYPLEDRLPPWKTGYPLEGRLSSCEIRLPPWKTGCLPRKQLSYGRQATSLEERLSQHRQLLS